MYKELSGEKQGDRIFPKTENSNKCQSDIWSIRKEQNQHAEWLKGYRKQLQYVKRMEKVEISQEIVNKQCKKMPN